MEYKIVRSQSAGVFAGLIESIDGETVTMLKARRLWYWVGAASLSELALKGVKKPKDCKFPIAVDRIVIRPWIEIIDVTPEARASIEGVPEWQA
ncbi:MAG: hypothetical protein WB421_14055 [Terriglobales bacterium]